MTDNAVSFDDFSPDHTGVNDVTPAWNSFLAAVTNSRMRRGFVPSGTYRFASQPNAITVPLTLFGAGGATVLQRDYNGSGGVGLVNIAYSAVILRAMTIKSSVGRTGGSMVSIITGATNIGMVSLEDLNLTTDGDCTQDYSLYVNGLSASVDPKGVRALSLRNVHVFGAKVAPAYFAGVIGLQWLGGGQYQAGCASLPSIAGIVITGTSLVQSYYATIDLSDALSGVSLDNLNYGNLRFGLLGDTGGISINNAGSANGIRATAGFATGTILSNWTKSAYTGGA